jgi:hypothetical protein
LSQIDAQFGLFCSHHLFICLFEFLYQEFLGLDFETARVVRLVERVLDSQSSLNINGFIETLINCYNSLVFFFLPNIYGIIFEKSFKNFGIVDSLDSSNILNFIFEGKEDIELFENTLLKPFEFEMRSVNCSIPSINDRLDLFELYQIVYEHQDDSIGR